jgi:hypothetical protein
VRKLLVLALAACGHSSSPVVTEDAPAQSADAAPDARVPVAPLTIHGLGVQGFVLHWGHDAVMTAPLYTRQSAVDVTLNMPLASDTAAIDQNLALENVPLDEVRAIVSGHAHYDHFIDVPHILDLAPNAVAATNMTGRHILAALAPDSCGTPPANPLPRDRVIAMDDPLASHVDYTNCPDQKPDGAPLEGDWLQVNAHVRLKAFCSMHPAQVGPYHFGAGAIDTDQCALPAPASGWLEGQTLAFVIDFLDDSGMPAYRVFYQDAPTNAPIGHVPDSVLAEKQVDVALLCVGSSDAVADQPGSILANLQPRFALSGHWEDFFQPIGSTAPIPLLDVNGYVDRANMAMPGAPEPGFLVDGALAPSRHILVQPGSRFVVPPGGMLDR